jgi:hypothetical protein
MNIASDTIGDMRAIRNSNLFWNALPVLVALPVRSGFIQYIHKFVPRYSLHFLLRLL